MFIVHTMKTTALCMCVSSSLLSTQGKPPLHLLHSTAFLVHV